MSGAATAVRAAGRSLRRGGRLLAQAWLLLGATLLCLLLLDRLLDAVLPERGHAAIDPAARAVPREQADAFADGAWASRYFAEFERARHTAWRPYVYFRRLPFAGELINLDAHGFRHTPNPTAPARQVWLFGGSMAWGTGVDDGHTLAAALGRALTAALGQPVAVHNFAESGYVSQQSLLAFAGALRCGGPRPDLAVFVDGVNDVYAALQSGQAGWPQNEQNRVAEFNLSRRADRVLLAWAARLKGVQKLLARPPAPVDAGMLGAAVADSYLATARQARALAAAEGIAVRLYWQPSLFDKPQRSRDEMQAHGASLALHRELQLAATAALRAKAAALPEFTLADEVFAETAAPRFFDYAHLNAAGIEQLAAWMAPALAAALPAAAQPTALPGTTCSERPVATGSDATSAP